MKKKIHFWLFLLKLFLNRFSNRVPESIRNDHLETVDFSHSSSFCRFLSKSWESLDLLNRTLHIIYREYATLILLKWLTFLKVRKINSIKKQMISIIIIRKKELKKHHDNEFTDWKPKTILRTLASFFWAVVDLDDDN